MGYADSTGAGGGTSRIERLRGQVLQPVGPGDRYRGDNCNNQPASAGQESRGIETATAIRQVVGAWSVDSFQEKRTLLRSRGTQRKKRLAAFVVALYNADAGACQRLTAEAIAEGGGPQAAARTLLGPAALWIGADWSSDSTDFLSVTIAMHRLQHLFHDMTEENPPPAPHDTHRRLLLAPAPGDQHGFGLSIVCDAFQRAGWAVDFCLNDDAGATLFRQAADQAYPLIGISLGADREAWKLKALVAALRSSNPKAGLMAGGRLALEHPQRLAVAGFDIVTHDTAAAILQAEQFIAAARHGVFVG